MSLSGLVPVLACAAGEPSSSSNFGVSVTNITQDGATPDHAPRDRVVSKRGSCHPCRAMLHPRSPFILLGGLAGLILATACSGTESRVCTEYFDRVEACAARATPEKAEMLRGLAKFAREGFQNNQNKTGVEDSCRDMLDQLNADPDCK